MAKIAILKGDKPNSDSEAYKTFEALQKVSDDDYELIEYKDLVFLISDTEFTVSYEKHGQDISLDQFDLVYIRDYIGYEHERNCVALYLKQHNTPFLNSDLESFQHLSKLTQYAMFAMNGVPIPNSLFASLARIKERAPDHFGYPFILKSITAKSGNDNYLIKEASDLDTITDASNKYIAQEAIPNEGDYRVIVMGDRVTCVYLRTSSDVNDHRNNISVGGTKKYVSLDSFPGEYKELAIKAALVVGREICGVDLMINTTNNQPVILEANFNFGIRAVDGTISEEVYGLSEFLHHKANK